MFDLSQLAVKLGLKKPRKFAFLRNGVQPVARVDRPFKTRVTLTATATGTFEFPDLENDQAIMIDGIQVSRFSGDATFSGFYLEKGAEGEMLLYNTSAKTWYINKSQYAGWDKLILLPHEKFSLSIDAYTSDCIFELEVRGVYIQ